MFNKKIPNCSICKWIDILDMSKDEKIIHAYFCMAQASRPAHLVYNNRQYKKLFIRKDKNE